MLIPPSYCRFENMLSRVGKLLRNLCGENNLSPPKEIACSRQSSVAFRKTLDWGWEGGAIEGAKTKNWRDSIFSCNRQFREAFLYVALG